MIKFLLKELEKSPNPLFTKKELLALSPEDFQKLIAKRVLMPHRPTSSDFENVRAPRCQHGCPLTVIEFDGGFEAICLDHPEEGSFPIEKDDLYRYALSVEGLLKQIRSANEISGNLQPIEGGYIYLGYKTFKSIRIGFIFISKLAQGELVKLSGLKHLCEKDEILVVLTPTSPIEDVILESRLRQDRMIQTSLVNSLDFQTFNLPIEELIKPIFEQAEAAGGSKTSVFRLMDGLRWKEVVISVVSNDSIRISARGKSERVTFADIGFKDGRRGDLPDLKWELLKEFAAYNGEINWENAVEANIHRTLKANVSILRKRLKTILGIDNDPFLLYRKHKAYITKFIIRDESFGKTSSY